MALLSPSRPIRILHLEDSAVDHELMLAQLARGGVPAEVRRVDNEGALNAALARDWDAVVCDYNLPGFSGLTILERLRARGLDLPVIIVSGEIGEATAVEAMRNGAADYVQKNNLARLAPALLHALEAAEDRRARARADRELDESKQRLRELAQHLQTSIEAERAAIAREIHDDVGGSLTALKFDLAWITRHTADATVAARAMSALETVALAIESTKRIMHNLRPAILEQGLAAALQWIATRFERRTGVTCRLRLPAELPELRQAVALVAYRTAQEALTNITKHAHARNVAIDLSLAGGVLSLEIVDDGRGLQRDDLTKSGSFGIRGLHERASTVGGWIDLSSGRTGTTLILSVPLDGGGTGDAFVRDRRDEPDDPTGWGEIEL